MKRKVDQVASSLRYTTTPSHVNELWMRVAVRERVEAGTEHDQLPHAPFDRARQRVFGKALARRDEDA